MSYSIPRTLAIDSYSDIQAILHKQEAEWAVLNEKYNEVFGNIQIRALLDIVKYKIDANNCINREFDRLIQFLTAKNDIYSIVPEHIISKEIMNPEWVKWFIKEFFRREFQY